MVNILKPVVRADTATYIKVANYPGLYRHSRSGRYYACKKLHGVRRERSLETCDRKIAERRLKEWVGNLEKVDAEVEKTTLAELIERYHAVTASLSESSRATDRSIIKKFLAWWPHGRDCQVRQIRPSMLDEWLARGRASDSARVFKVKDAKKALSAACARLNLPHFSQRNLRQSLIRRLIRAKVDVKSISKWQGHQDGGQLPVAAIVCSPETLIVLG